MDPILVSLQKCIDQLSSTNSNLEKVDILRQFPDLQEILDVLLDPHKTTGVTKASLETYKRAKFPRFPDRARRFPHDVTQMLNALTSRAVSGDDAKEMVWTLVERDPTHKDLILKIATKDLKTRLGRALFTQAFLGGADENKYSPALAYDIEKHMDYFQRSVQKGERWFISRKLDGCRVQVHSTPPVRSCSRAGNPFVSLKHLNEMVARSVPPGFVFDCEICVVRSDGSESFSEAVGAVKRHEPMETFHLFVFDILTKEEFDHGESVLTFSQRLARAPQLLQPLMAQNTAHRQVSLLPQALYTPDVFREWQDQVDERGWEGLMLRKDVGYEGKRTKNLLKVKKFQTGEYKILGFKTGPFRMVDPKTGLEKEIETVTAVEILHKGYPVSVGSGFSVEQRQEMFKNPKFFLNKIIAVKYFEELRSADGSYSLRFPTFQHLYGHVRDV